MSTKTKDMGLTPVQEAGNQLTQSVVDHSPQKANAAGRARRSSHGSREGRPVSDFQVTFTAPNGGKKVSRVATSYDAAVELGLWMLTFGETGEVEVHDRENDVTWRLTDA